MSHDDLANIIEQARGLGHSVEVLSDVKSGKEAVVYRVLLDGQLAAMKLYKDPERRSFKQTSQYLAGKYVKKASERRALAKQNKFGKRLRHENWIEREYYVLDQLHSLGAKIPEPLLRIDNAIFMEFIGDAEGVAPRLCDVKLSEKEAKTAFDQVLETISIFWDFGIVHADLSEYNILWWDGQPYVIDFPQAVDKRTHPNATELYERDLRNVTKYFEKPREQTP